MRRCVLLLLAAAWLGAGTARAQDAYAGVLLEYLTGDADAAVTKVQALDREEILAGLRAFNTTRSRLVLTGAAALHTEAAFRSRISQRVVGVFQLDVAAAIVQFGEPAGLKSGTPYSIAPAYATPVSDEFRRLWYCTVIGILQDTGLLRNIGPFLAHALTLYPKSGEIQLLAGVGLEMQGSPRTSNMSEGDRRDALRAAEKYYRAALALQPDRLEAQLRLGRVLQRRNDLDGARTRLAPLVSSNDDRIAYLAALFLGGLEDASRHPEAAAVLYDKAAARLPAAQTARLAASELRHRRGDRQAAADAVPAAAGAANEFDPWWTYIFGEYWRGDSLLDALRKMRRA